MKKVIQGSVRLIWRAEKVRCQANHRGLNMQAVPLAGGIF